MSTAYLPLVLEHYRRPRNFGALPAPDASHEGTNPLCGDRVRIELAVEGDRIGAARFRGDACAVTIAAASLLTERVTGQSLAAVAALTEADALALLGGELPAARRRCGTLPLDVLQAAVRALNSGSRP
jgi:nitrogen fixation protein NifU and related proteins